MLGTAHKVEVEAPDGAAALELEHRLYALHPTAVFRRGRWVVDLPGVHSVEDVASEVKEWLRLIGARPRPCMSTDARSGSSRKRCRVTERRTPTSSADAPVGGATDAPPRRN